MIYSVKASMRVSSNILFRIIAKFRSRLINPRIRLDKHIPIVINNFNRLEYLIKMLSWFEKAGYTNIYIIDNSSSYPPLLDFYQKTQHTVFKLDKNVGHLALWRTHVYLYFLNTYYVYTDPDILPIEECPEDILSYFKSILERHPKIGKVGFGLKIDDIPDYYSMKVKVIQWESKFWENEIEKDIFEAEIDTTFALYRPNIKGDYFLPALRTAGQYLARHLPWYINDKEVNSEEELHYQKTSSQSSSWYKRKEIYE